MSTQHTPGPWWHSGLEVGTVPMMMVKVAKVSGANHQEAQANARLIAAAPDLLEALKDALLHVGNQGDVGVDEWIACERKALAAIAKATNA